VDNPSLALSSGFVAFRDELPVPEANLVVYEQIYVLEQWLRRIAYAGLMARYATNWQRAMPNDLANDLKRRLRQLSGRVHLDCENSDNMIWLLTLDELGEVLLAKQTWPMVKSLSQLPRHVLETRLAELRGIRNVVGHNRAVSANTALLTAGIAVALSSGIESFKTQLLYSDSGTIHFGSVDDDDVPGLFARWEVKCDPQSQIMLTEGEHFYSLTRLPIEPFDSHLRVRSFLNAMAPLAHEVLAVLVNRMGDEFTLAWPKRASAEVHERVMSFFFAEDHHRWTQTPYEQQSPSAICDPRVWFYENQRPCAE
jgi:hypothetical protein